MSVPVREAIQASLPHIIVEKRRLPGRYYADPLRNRDGILYMGSRGSLCD